MDDPRWSSLGPSIWLRFRAVGMVRPFQQVARWLRENPETDARAVLLSSTRYALARAGTPDSDALKAFHCNHRQMMRVLAAPESKRLGLVLGVLDGMDDERVAELVKTSTLAVRAAQDELYDDLQEYADPELDGTQFDGHPTTLELLGFANETLGPLKAGQVENHVSSCSACYERFEAWSQHTEAFAERVPPAPPAPPPDRRPLLAFVGLVLVGGLVVVGGLAASVLTLQSQRTASEAFALQPASVQLLVDGRPIQDVGAVPAGKLIQVQYDGHNASHVSMAIRRDGHLDPLVRSMIPSPSAVNVAPVEIVASPGQHETLYVALAMRPLTDEDLMQAVRGEPAEDLSVSVIDLDGSP